MGYSDKSNKDIQVEVKKIELDHANMKAKLISLLNEIEELEKKYAIAKSELNKRGINL